MTRAFILVIDSLGIGGAADAADFGDSGADTWGHIAEACALGKADRPGLRQGRLVVPNLIRLGLAHAAAASSGRLPAGLAAHAAPAGAHGFASETSRGKDTPSGHWEIAGLPVDFDWGYFPRIRPCFPPRIIETLIEDGALPGILGDCHASGTEIIERLGVEHIETGKPICYTSADSVFQIAAHESHFGLDRLYELCARAKSLLEPLNIARVIARPFVGEVPGEFRRTANRRDLTTPPHGPTLLDHAFDTGREVVSVGKIADIFAGRGISRKITAANTDGLFALTLREVADATDGALVFVNFVDFDTLYGHRRDIAGYAAALEAFDLRLPALEARLQPGDLAILTADHGCDPTFPGSDHTRENIPVIMFGPNVTPRDLGRRESFADIGQSVAAHLGLSPLPFGRSCLS
ncbi:MAG: phosphopentomutase [Proteobacteria bacterium]|nr:phosphopentomutase [Pseudomonadota bacterium]